MKDIREIIADNLIELRKTHKLTQNELADKLNYSDNTVSRWEHAEITPSIETLQQIANIYNVPLEFLLRENMTEEMKKENSVVHGKKIATLLLLVCQVWFIAAFIYFYLHTFIGLDAWTIFIWAVPISCLIVTALCSRWEFRITGFIMSTILLWSLATAIYLQFMWLNLSLIYLIAIPTQVTLVVWTFIRKS